MENKVLMPRNPPDELNGDDMKRVEFDEVLFELCRKDNYRGIYREFVRRYAARAEGT